MPVAQKNYIGKEGFVWWIGVVEDRNDPEQLGRVRVRCFGWHTDDKNMVPTDALPWAHTVMPVNNPAAYTPKEGDMVLGFFMDGVYGQNPVVMGILPGKPSKKPKYDKGFTDPRTDFSKTPKKPETQGEAYPLKLTLNEPTLTRLSRNKTENTVIKTKKNLLLKEIKNIGEISWAEPQPAFNPTYPYNFAHETESGHAFEMDDTPGKERVSLSHRTGTSFEIDSSGNKVEKIIKDNYYLLFGSDYVYIGGNVNVTVDGTCNLKVLGKLNAEAAEMNFSASGDLKIKAANIKMESTGALDIKSAGAGKITSSTVDIKSGGAANFTAGGAVGIKGGGSVALTGSSVEVSGKLNAGDTNLKATGKDTGTNGGSDHNLSIAGPGGTSAAAASDAADSGLTFTEVQAQTIPSANASSNTGTTDQTTTTEDKQVVGKDSDGITSNSSNSTNQISSAVDKATTAAASNLPVGEITKEINKAAEVINNSIGEISGLEENLKNIALDKIDEFVTKIESSGFVTGLSDEIKQTANLAANKIVDSGLTVAKRIYPRTEVIARASTSNSTNTSG